MSYASRLIKKINEEQTKKVPAEYKEIYDKLIETLKEETYPEFVDHLNNDLQKKIYGDKKLQFFLQLGFGGPLADTKLTSQVTAIPVANLIPTQNEIDVTKSLSYPLSGKDDLHKFFDSKPVKIVAPIVTFNSNYIIDGHHRWSQAYCVNPECDIVAVNFSGRLSPAQVLKITQATIGSNLGTIPTQEVKQGTNLFGFSKQQLRDYVAKTLSEETEKQMKEIKRFKDRNEVVDWFTHNGMILKANNEPINGAPKRNIMPQTDTDDDCLTDMSHGVTKL